MKKMKDYFTTGEFAKIFGVKKQTLFHYDDIGIFSPEITGENGYRYYSFTQLETFAVLLMMKGLNVPLKEIKAHMDNRSPEALITLLEKQRVDIEERIKELQWSKKYIDAKIRLTREGMSAPLGKVVFEDVPDEYLVTTNYRGPDDEKAVAEAVSEHFSYCHSLGIYSAYAIGGMIPVDSITEDSYKYSKFYTIVDSSLVKSHKVKSAFLDTGGKYLAMYDNHGYDNVHDICLELLDYAKKNHLKLGDSFYEDVILDDLSTNGYYNYLTKISIDVL